MSLLSWVLVCTWPSLALVAEVNFQNVFGMSPTTATVVDARGNIYLTGSTTSPAFPVTAGAFQKTIIQSICGYTGGPQGSQGSPIYCGHAYVAKIDPTGTRLIYATY